MLQSVSINVTVVHILKAMDAQNFHKFRSYLKYWAPEG
jgi:hypothetical protein